MKKFIIFATIILHGFHVNADDHKKTQIVKYELEINFNKEKQRLSINLKNKSPFDFFIRRDSLPSSLLIRGIKFFAFEDSQDLNRVPMLYHIGSAPQLIKIPAGEGYEDFLELRSFMRNYCEILKKNPILVFWNYSAKSGEEGEYLLLPTDGVFRIKKEDVVCE